MAQTQECCKTEHTNLIEGLNLTRSFFMRLDLQSSKVALLCSS